MRLYIILLIFTIGISTSCKDLFNPEEDTVNLPLVVEGLITDEATSYTVKLFTATKFSSNEDYSNVTNAMVTVSDDCGNTYKFTETTSGIYVSNPAEFVGQPGRTYTLSVSSDNYTFNSDPQLLFPNDFDVKTYAEFGSQNQLVDNGSDNPYVETVQGVNLLVDVNNNSDTLPRFRFVHTTYNEYKYYVQISPSIIYGFYCWKYLSDNDLFNLTTGDLQTSTKNIERHAICFIPKIEEVTAYFNGSAIPAYVIKQISKVSQYRINNETYQYYKDANSIMAAQGKLFDPIAFQLKGNMKCISNLKKEVLGFFEASSVRTGYYAIKPGSKDVSKIMSFEPPSLTGCASALPDFWVN